VTAELVAALLIAPVLPGGPEEKRDPHDDSPEGEYGGQDQDPGHTSSIALDRTKKGFPGCFKAGRWGYWL
jgi:hypothetical protein